MRKKQDAQGWLEFQPSNLKLTNDHFERYEAISKILDRNSRLLDLVHRDLEAALEAENGERTRRGGFLYTSEMVLRLVVCQILEGASLRELVVRVDDGHRLRSFTRIHGGPMMSHASLCRLRNAIQPETWKKLNTVLAKAAVKGESITGTHLRLDTTAVETNIHWPTDSSLLQDGYRKLSDLIEDARSACPTAVGDGRLQRNRTRKLALRIARKSQHKGKSKELKPLYKRLLRSAERICDWADDVQEGLMEAAAGTHDASHAEWLERLAGDLRHYGELTRHVIGQASERVLHGRRVANEDKLFSIFEEHTELLVRGKAGKNVEFGHMIQIQQTGEKFITDYEVFESRPYEPGLVEEALKSHEKLFGSMPESVATDKGYWAPEVFEHVAQDVETVSIPKKGRRNEEEDRREHDVLFRMAQAFRAGVEGSISYLKRVFRLTRCMNKGWQQYVSTVGATVFTHNLLVLARL